MGFFSHVTLIVHIEVGFFRRFHKLLMAAVFVSLIPSQVVAGAYDDAWQLPLLLLLSDMAAILFASVWGRCCFVDTKSVRPAVDF